MAKLKIYNDIVGEEEKVFCAWAGVDAIAFSDVDAFIASIPKDDNKIELVINCRGGRTDAALAIYDALRASGKEISAEVIGECSSSATLLLLAAKAENRKARPNATILIHNPYISGFVEGDAERIGSIADALNDTQEKFLNIYVDRTKADRETLLAMMKEDKPMNVAQAIELGFLHEEIAPISAQRNTHKKFKSMKFREIIKALRGLAAYGMVLETVDGKTLELRKENGVPTVGDEVISEDGEYTMPDGSTIVVENAVIAEIRPKEPSPVPVENADDAEERREENEETDEQLAEKDAEIDRLKAELAEKDAEIERLQEQLQEAQSNAKSADDIAMLNMVETAGGMAWLKSVQSNGKAARRDTSSQAMERIEARKTDAMSYAEYRKAKAERRAKKN